MVIDEQAVRRQRLANPNDNAVTDLAQYRRCLSEPLTGHASPGTHGQDHLISRQCSATHPDACMPADTSEHAMCAVVKLNSL